MKIVLIEDLAVSNEQIEQAKNNLKKQGHELIYKPGMSKAKEQIDTLKDADILIIGNMPLHEEAIDKANNLKFIDVAFTGTDHIPVAAASKRNIPVSNASGYATEAVAELALYAMIDLFRKIEPLQTAVRNSKTKTGIRGRLLNGKTVGIVGAGHIGSKTAQYAKALGAKTLGYCRHPKEDPNIDQFVLLDQLLTESDIVSLHVPLNESTRHLISKEQFELMKPDAFLINTARGPVVDSAALIDALNQKQIAGAALDVFDQEPPLSKDDPLLSFDRDQLILTPHIGFDSEESMIARFNIAMDNLQAFLDGHPKNVVNNIN
ncbi:NAD(P)-dependent oxidoreductase [Ileibacterium valens]|uniref:NAD(P)-dependent oxidoreductase n=1 Tax=Ileibacterium valens TaxID=1862668 RepID=UPI00259B2699|nr:NAD(P)-dependent oxidoreductase [Ileibacterium valens]